MHSSTNQQSCHVARTAHPPPRFPRTCDVPQSRSVPCGDTSGCRERTETLHSAACTTDGLSPPVRGRYGTPQPQRPHSRAQSQLCHAHRHAIAASAFAADRRLCTGLSACNGCTAWQAPVQPVCAPAQHRQQDGRSAAAVKDGTLAQADAGARGKLHWSTITVMAVPCARPCSSFLAIDLLQQPLQHSELMHFLHSQVDCSTGIRSSNLWADPP